MKIRRSVVSLSFVFPHPPEDIKRLVTSPLRTVNFFEQGDSFNRGDDNREMGDFLPSVLLGTDMVPTSVVTGMDFVCVILENGGVKVRFDSLSDRIRSFRDGIMSYAERKVRYSYSTEMRC